MSIPATTNRSSLHKDIPIQYDLKFKVKFK